MNDPKWNEGREGGGCVSKLPRGYAPPEKLIKNPESQGIEDKIPQRDSLKVVGRADVIVDEASEPIKPWRIGLGIAERLGKREYPVAVIDEVLPDVAVVGYPPQPDGEACSRQQAEE